METKLQKGLRFLVTLPLRILAAPFRRRRRGAKSRGGVATGRAATAGPAVEESPIAPRSEELIAQLNQGRILDLAMEQLAERAKTYEAGLKQARSRATTVVATASRSARAVTPPPRATAPAVRPSRDPAPATKESQSVGESEPQRRQEAAKNGDSDDDDDDDAPAVPVESAEDAAATTTTEATEATDDTGPEAAASASRPDERPPWASQIGSRRAYEPEDVFRTRTGRS